MITFVYRILPLHIYSHTTVFKNYLKNVLFLKFSQCATYLGSFVSFGFRLQIAF